MRERETDLLSDCLLAAARRIESYALWFPAWPAWMEMISRPILLNAASVMNRWRGGRKEEE